MDDHEAGSVQQIVPRPPLRAGVTISICTRNRPEPLYACLKSIVEGEVLPLR